MAEGPAYRRHDLVRVDPAAWREMLAARPDLDGVPHLPDWAERGRPLIVRRFAPGDARTQVPLGLPLPPTDGKRRIGFIGLPENLSAFTAPLLSEVGKAAPSSWVPTIAVLLALAERHGVRLRMFGGLLWQHVTGLPYLTAASDLDLIWEMPGMIVGSGLLHDLAGQADVAPMRLDGEVVLADGGGIHWRELRDAPANGEVLVKHIDRLEMRSATALRERRAP